MAKKKRATASRSRKTGARRKTTPRRKTSPRRKASPRPKTARTAASRPGQLRLKDVRRQIETALASLETVKAREAPRYDQTAERFQSMLSDIDWLCDPDNPDGCGPDMVFPIPG